MHNYTQEEKAAVPMPCQSSHAGLQHQPSARGNITLQGMQDISDFLKQ